MISSSKSAIASETRNPAVGDLSLPFPAQVRMTAMFPATPIIKVIACVTIIGMNATSGGNYSEKNERNEFNGSI